MCHHFGCDTPEETQELRSDAFVSPGQRTVTLDRIKATLDLLVREGFTKTQMRAALPLLFYSQTLVEGALREMRAAPEFAGLDWDEERRGENFLRLCLYFVERDFNFGGDGFYVGFRPALSEEFLGEVGALAETERRWARAAAADADEAGDDYSGADAGPAAPPSSPVSGHLEPSFDSLETRTHPVAQHRPRYHQKQGVRQLHTSAAAPRGSSGGSDDGNQKSAWTFRLNFRNPFEAFRVHTEFLKLKSEWDPAMDKASFVEATKEVRKKLLGTPTSINLS